MDTAFHLMTVWNEADYIHKDAPDTICVHAQILDKYKQKSEERYVWWGKISISGNKGINSEDLEAINRMIASRKQSTYLFLYGPNPNRGTLHVGKLLEVSDKDKSFDNHTPPYYRQTGRSIPFWFKLTDIERISLIKTFRIMKDDKGNPFDVVRVNFYPCKIYLSEDIEYFKYKDHFIHLLKEHDMRCFKTGSACTRADELEYNPRRVFIGCPFEPSFLNQVKFAINPVLKRLKFEPWIASDSPKKIDIMCKVCGGIQRSGKAIIDITQWNANVMFELGLLYGLGKDVLLINQEGKDSPADLKGMEYLKYTQDDYEGLQNLLQKYLEE